MILSCYLRSTSILALRRLLLLANEISPSVWLRSSWCGCFFSTAGHFDAKPGEPVKAGRKHQTEEVGSVNHHSDRGSGDFTMDSC